MICPFIYEHTHLFYYIIKESKNIRKMEKPSRGNLFDDDSDEGGPPVAPPKVEETPAAEVPAAEA